MKKIFVFLLGVTFLSMSTIVSAQSVVLVNPLGTIDTFNKLLTNIIAFIAELIAGISIVMLIWAGILYLIAGGSQNTLQHAHKALIYAIIGMVVGFGGEIIVITIKNIIGVTST